MEKGGGSFPSSTGKLNRSVPPQQESVLHRMHRTENSADLAAAVLLLRQPGQLGGKSAGLVIERLRVRIPAEAA